MFRQKRLLVLNHNVREHGTYFRAWKTASLLALRGWEVTFVCTGPQRYRARRGRHDGMTVWETPNWTWIHAVDEGWSLPGLLWRLFLAVSRRWDVVYSFSHRPIDQLPARLARAIWGARWVCDWCDLYGGEGLNAMGRADSKLPPVKLAIYKLCDRIDNALENAAARGCDLLTVISTFLYDRAVRLGRDSRRIHFLRSGADIARIRPLGRLACRARLGLPEDRLLLGFVSNFHPDEAMMLDALEIVFSERPDVDLLAVCPDFPGGKKALENRGIADRVIHVGRVPFAQIPIYLGASDLLLVPMRDTAYNRSRWPNKIGDYLAAGRAQVACRVGEVGDVMRRFEAGVGCGPEPKDFARAIRGLLDDPATRERLGREARRVAEEHFHWPQIVARLEERLEKELFQ